MPDTTFLHMEQLAGGDDAAFDLIIERYKSRVFGIIYRYIQDRTLAEDLAQEVFIRIYNSRNSYAPTAKFSTWVYTITAHLCLNEIRRRKAEGKIVSLHDAVSGGEEERIEGIANGKAHDPYEDLDRGETAQAVRAAIESLPDQQRMAVILLRFEEMSYEEIGKAMKMSVPAIKSLLTRARENMRRKLAPFLSRRGEKIDT